MAACVSSRSGFHISGKFLEKDGLRFPVKGVSYGTFAPDSDGYQFPSTPQLAQDFHAMRQFGINTLRTYTVPSTAFLDEAKLYGLSVIVGVPWAQHVTFLDDRKLARTIRRDLATEVRRVGAHPATLAVCIGNEIPASIVRWHGSRRIERFVRELYESSKEVAPDVLVTYVNYPPTEFLELPFLDLCAFNVYLHREHDLAAYLARLQHLAGTRPLMVTEAGADSCRHGEEGQAALTAMQIRTAFTAGACGVVAFAWTDDWWRGGERVSDWAFGLTDVERQPKLALYAAARAFSGGGFADPQRVRWPRVSVLVCAYNAAETMEDCLCALECLNYPDFEIIVVNDGSRDATGDIVRRFPRAMLVETPNRGLSAARNTALERARGEIVAYTDADVRVDPDWLTYLVQPFLHSDVLGAGGPNVVPPDDPWLAQCIARSPGGPTHVLIDDQLAEHVPGCNMAFRREALLALGGFDEIYRVAGDDVDLCWRAQARGGRIGFAPAALVWHHHRRTVRAYWRQQAGYGEAETWLMEHHPERFLDGNALWGGRIYSPLPLIKSISRVRVNAGVWGTAPFPSVYCTHAAMFPFFPHFIPCQIIALILSLLAGVTLGFGQPIAAFTLLAAAFGGLTASVIRCAICAWQSDISRIPAISGRSWLASRVMYRSAIAWFHFLQPIARAWGRIRGHFWLPNMDSTRLSAVTIPKAPFVVELLQGAALLSTLRRTMDYWGERWVDRTDLLTKVTRRVRSARVGRTVIVDDGWQLDRDFAVAVGRWTWLNVSIVAEEHARGRCLLRVRSSARMTQLGVLLTVLACAVALIAGLSSPLMRALTVVASIGIVSQKLRQLARIEAAVRAIIGDVADGIELQPLWRRSRSLATAVEFALGVDAVPLQSTQSAKEADAH